jgi:hypothetical protein
MAMTKEEQAIAASRILAKCPLTAEEKQLAEVLKRTPEMYIVPTKDGLRTCGICGAEFQDVGEGKHGEVAVTALQQFCDHQAEHNPSPSQWTEAYNKIRKSKQESPS